MREHERRRNRPEFHRIAIRCFMLGVGIAYYASRDLVCVRFWIGPRPLRQHGSQRVFSLPGALTIAKKVQGIHKAADANIFEGTGT